MTPERWQKINEVFQSVVGLETDRQEAYLNEACAGDESLRQQVETLLAANDEAGTFIAGKAAEDVGHLLTGDQHKSLTGDSLGHYEIISVLGSGGMGKVYLAKDSKLNRAIAVKTLPVSFSPNSDYVKRFKTEAKAAANLNHPNVATVYSVEETDENQFFITMEYIEGESLGKMIPTDGLDFLTFLDWFTQIADALSHAHEKGVVHRDIKPNNIMVTPGGTPKILDFGLARIDQGDSAAEGSTLNLTKTGQVLGTPAYMSPEQAEGKPADQRSDIFSLGVVMYEAITGQRPFKGESYASVISQLLTKEPTPVADLKPDAPYLLSRLIMKCLSKEPRYRYQSMNEVRLILQETRSAIDSGASLSRPGNLSYDKSGSSWLTYSLIGLLAIGSLIAAWYWLGPRQTLSNPVVKFQVRPDASPVLNVTGSQISRDGTQILLPTFSSEGLRFYLRSLGSFETKAIEGTEGGNNGFFSPDGKWIAFSTKGEALKKVALKGGNPVALCDSCTSSRNGWWGDDDNIYIPGKKGISVISSDGGTPELLTTIDESKGEKEHYHPRLLPNRKALLFTVVGKNTSKLAVYSLDQKTTKYIDETGQANDGNYVKSGYIVFARGAQLMAIPFDQSSLTASGKPVLLQTDLFGMFPNVQVSDNGTLLYLPEISRATNQVVWVDRAGKQTPAIKKQGNFSSPRLAPDGERVAVSFENDVWVYDLASGIGTRITDDGVNSIPMWSNDGKWVIYVTQKDSEYTVYRKNPDGRGTAEVIVATPSKISPYSINPKDETLALSETDAQGNSDIVTKLPDADKPTTFLSSKFREDTPRFSPDGRWLAYFSMETGSPQIYTVPWGEEGRRVPITNEGGIFPVWARNGKELFYRSANRFYSVTVDTSNGFSISNRKLMFVGKYLTSFDVSTDGEKFLMVKDEYGTLPKDINLVIGWNRELEQILNSAK